MTFDTLKARGQWEPIRDCPGRLVLRGVSAAFGLDQLLGNSAIARQYQSANARDEVWVVRLDDCGTISYRRSDGTWLHTLNTSEGFKRKLEQLQIRLNE